MIPSPACLALIQRFEGCERKLPDGRFAAYPDPGTGGAPWTIGWGSTGPDIAPGLIWTQQQCDSRFEHDVLAFAAQVSDALGDARTSQHQFDALVSFAYNIGIARLRTSTLLQRHKAGDFAGAAGQFARWRSAGGRVLQGLIKRRAAEAALYRS